MARRKVARSTPKPKNCRTTRRKTCAKTKKPKKESKLKKLGKFALGAGALAGAGALGYYAHKNKDKLAGLYSAGMNKLNDYYQTGREGLSDLVETSKIKANDWLDAGRTQVRHLKDAAYGYMTNFADKISADNDEGYINTARNVTSKYINDFAKKLKQYKNTDLVPYQPSDIDTMLNNFKDSVKTSNNFDPNQYMNIAYAYLADMKNRDPFKTNNVIPDFMQGLHYLMKADMTSSKGETYFADTYKKGLENVLDTLISKRHRLME